MRAILSCCLVAPLLALSAVPVEAGPSGGARQAQSIQAEPGRAPVEDAIRRPYTFTMVRSGGFAGVHDELVVDSAKMLITYQSRFHSPEPVTARVTEADLRALEHTLENADFLNIRKPYECRMCADHFQYDATLKMEGGREHAVHWEDDSPAPEELWAIRDLWGRLIEEHFLTR